MFLHLEGGKTLLSVVLKGLSWYIFLDRITGKKFKRNLLSHGRDLDIYIYL